MKKIAIFFWTALFALAGEEKAFAQESGAMPAKHVVLISIDGLRPEFYTEAERPTPNLRHLMLNGAHAKGVSSVFPSVTYPSHTTLITGAMPATHGVYYNTIFSDTGSTGNWYREEKWIQTETLWDAVKKKGLKSACVSWPVSVGADIDYNIPEAWVNNKVSINPHVKPDGLFEEIQQNATGKLDYSKMNLDNLAIDENLSRMAAYLIKTYKPHFTAVHIVCVDHAQHSSGREGPEVDKALASADHAVGNILDAIKAAGMEENTAVIVTGDHGFSDVHTSISPNTLLVRNGLLNAGDKKEWKAMFHGGGASSFLHLKNPKDTETLHLVESIIDSLSPRERKLFRVVKKDELIRMGADPRAALALAPIEGVSVSGTAAGDFVRMGRGGTHGFFPDFEHIKTGFIASGAGIRMGTVVPEMGLEDVAPVISALLGLDFKAKDGVLLPGIIQQPNAGRNARR